VMRIDVKIISAIPIWGTDIIKKSIEVVVFSLVGVVFLVVNDFFMNT
jgi:hypothetical protein